MNQRSKVQILSLLVCVLVMYFLYVYSNLEIFTSKGEIAQLQFELNRIKAENMRLRAVYDDILVSTKKASSNSSTASALRAVRESASNLLSEIVGSGEPDFSHVPELPDEDFLGKYVDILRGCNMLSYRENSRGNIYPIVARPWPFSRWTITSAQRKQPWFFSAKLNSFDNVRYTHQPSPWIGDYSYFTVAPFVGTTRGTSSRFQHLTYRKARFNADRVFLDLSMRGEPQFEVEFTGTRHGGRIRVKYLTSETRGLEFQNTNNFVARQVSSTRATFTFNTKKLAGRGIPYLHRGEMVTFVSGVLELSQGATQLKCSDVGCTWEQANEVDVLIGASYISTDQAGIHLEREVSKKSFEELVEESNAEWNGVLGRVKVSGAFADEKKTLYSALYRAALWPSRLGEVGAQGVERHRSPYERSQEVHLGPLSTDSGFWDAYIAVYPMLHLIYPEIVEEVIEGWINAIREDANGMLAQWAAPGRVGSMVGSMGETTIAEAIVNGAVKKPDSLKDAYNYIRRSATTGTAGGREHMSEYLRMGYVPCRFPDSVSLTLNYKLADYSVSRAAKVMGDFATARTLLLRSQEWNKLYNNGFLAPKTGSGQFRHLDTYLWMKDYTEGSAWHYRFYVPHDPKGLRDAFQANKPVQGETEMCKALKQTMVEPPKVTGGGRIHEQNEMINNVWGQYAHNNQPAHHMLYMFAPAGCPITGQEFLFKALRTQYGTFGYTGDEDNGEMSSWYILSALGLYALAPGSGEYQIGAPPLFKEVVITRKTGGVLYIARDIDRSNIEQFTPAKSVVWNGVTKDISKEAKTIPYKELLDGGELRFRP